MGASDFENIIVGKYTIAEAFRALVEKAQYEYGHGGYTGTIAEKDSWILIECPDKDPHKFANKLIEDDDNRISDKWGDAGCIDIKKTNLALFKRLKEKYGHKGKKGINAYLFFGWASS